MKTIQFVSICLFLSWNTILPANSQSVIDGLWQNGNQTLFFQNGQYQEVIDQQVVANGRFGVGNGFVRITNVYGGITDIPAKTDHSHLYLFNNNQWQTFKKTSHYQQQAQPYNSGNYSNISSSTQDVMRMTQEILGEVYRIAFDPNVKIDPSTIPGEHRKYMEISNEVFKLQDLFKRLDRGDPNAKKELEAYSRYLDQMSHMLGGMVASAKTKNSIRRQQLAMEWINQGFDLRELGDYYKRQGNLQKAGHHFSKADEYLNASKKILQ